MKLFRSLEKHSYAVISEQQSACAENFSLHFFYKTVYFLLGFRAKIFGTLSKNLWFSTVNVLTAFSKLTSIRPRKLFDWSVLKRFVNITYAFWLWAKDFDNQQDFFVNVFKTAFCLSRRTIWKYFVKLWIQSFFWHRATICFRVGSKVSSTVLKTAIFVRWGTICFFFKINCDDFLDLERRNLGLWAKLLGKCSQKCIPRMQNSILGFCFPQWFWIWSNFLSDFV